MSYTAEPDDGIEDNMDAMAALAALLPSAGLITLAKGLCEVANTWGYGEVRIVIANGKPRQIKTTRSQEI